MSLRKLFRKYGSIVPVKNKAAFEFVFDADPTSGCFCPLRIEIGLAQVVQERHDNQALVRVFSSIFGTYNPACFLLKKELPYDTITL